MRAWGWALVAGAVVAVCVYWFAVRGDGADEVAPRERRAPAAREPSRMPPPARPTPAATPPPVASEDGPSEQIEAPPELAAQLERSKELIADVARRCAQETGIEPEPGARLRYRYTIQVAAGTGRIAAYEPLEEETDAVLARCVETRALELTWPDSGPDGEMPVLDEILLDEL